jgi:hypothetical protein
MSTRKNAPPAEEVEEESWASGAVTAARFQFRLSHLFLATFLVASITFIAIIFGPGSLPLSIGITLAWLNVRGLLGWFQQRHTRARVCYVAWFLIATSLALPSVKGCNQKPVKGWQAAQMAVMAEGAALEKLATNPDRIDGESCVFVVYFMLINLANLLALMSPLLLYRLQKGKGRLMGNTLAFASVAVWMLPWGDPEGYFIGYYVWSGGLTLLLHTMRLGWRTFLGMAICGPVALAIGTQL